MKNVFVSLAVLLILFSLLGCSKKETEEQLKALGQNYEKEERYNDAIRSYEKLIELYPKGKFADEAQHRIAFIYYNNFQDYDKAIEAYKKVVENFPNSKYVEQARFMIGYIFANNIKDYDKARQAYNDFLKHHPNSELADDVQWELDHLGQDIEEQLFGKTESKHSNGKVSPEKTNSQ